MMSRNRISQLPWMVVAAVMGLIAAVLNLQVVGSPDIFPSEEAALLVSTVARGVGSLAEIPLAVSVSETSASANVSMSYPYMISFLFLSFITCYTLAAMKRVAK